MTMAALSLVVSVLTGLLLVERLWSADRRGTRDAWLKLSLAAGLGPGVSGMLAFFVTLAVGFRREAIIGADLALLALLAVLVIRRKPWRAPAKAAALPLSAEPAWTAWLCVPFLIASAAAAVAFVAVIRQLPDGGWDAWAFWNLRAKYLVLSPPGEWMRAFEATPGLIGFLPDYPPLYPFIVARSWAWGAVGWGGVPVIVAALYTFSILGLMATALAGAASRTAGFLAAIVLAGTPTFFQQGAWRLADAPLGWFILAAVALFALAEARGRWELLVLAGLACGLAGLTKNEGALFMAAAAAAWGIATWRRAPKETRRRDLAAFAAGLALPLLAFVWFKGSVAPGVGLGFVGPEGAEGALPAWSMAKNAAILKVFASSLFSTDPWCAFPWALLVVVPLLGLGRPPRAGRAAIVAAALTGVMGLGFYLAYATTPFEVTWLLATTIMRLFTQVAPLVIFTIFLFTRSPQPKAAVPPSARMR